MALLLEVSNRQHHNISSKLFLKQKENLILRHGSPCILNKNKISNLLSIQQTLYNRQSSFKDLILSL
jgi:hypothetical protein